MEQATALAATDKSIDINVLRSWWNKTMNSQPGLSVDTTRYSMDDIAGLNSFKEFAAKVMNGMDKPGVVVRIDEIEKALSGASGPIGDTSGVSQDILGQLLSFMEDEEADGLIAVGMPGSGKSMCSIAMGSAGGVPTVSLDIGGLKGSLVGQSEQQTRAALRTIKALAKRVFFMATCNSMSQLPPELRRRFTYGIWYFDPPDEEELEKLWELYTKKYEVPDERPDDYSMWTGAEVRNACRAARNLVMTPKQIGERYIVPVCVQAANTLRDLREQADGKYLSASYPGVFRMKKNDNRRMKL